MILVVEVKPAIDLTCSLQQIVTCATIHAMGNLKLWQFFIPAIEKLFPQR